MTRPSATALLLAVLLPAAAAAAGGDAVLGGHTGSMVGPESCKACHPAAYEVWRAGPHARSLDGLPAQSRKDPRCLSCHAPDVEAGIQGIGCEACHGPGRVYSAPYVMRDAELARAVGLVDPGEKSCLACHGESAPSLVRFAYARKLPLIDHWTRERQAAGARAEPAAAPRGK